MIIRLFGLMILAVSVPVCTADSGSVVGQQDALFNGQSAAAGLASVSSRFEYARQLEMHLRQRILSTLSPVLGEQHVHAEVTADIYFMPSVPDAGCSCADITPGHTASPAGNRSPPADNPRASAGVDPHVIRGGTLDDQAARTGNKSPDKKADNSAGDLFMLNRGIGRLSVVVLIDDKRLLTAEGSVMRVKRTEEELALLRQLVKGAVAFQPQRGDSLQIVNASFLPSEAQTQTPFWAQKRFWQTATTVAGGILVLLFLLFVLRPLLTRVIQPSQMSRVGEKSTGEGQVQQSEAEDRDAVQASSRGQYQGLLNEARDRISEDPKRAAQVIKQWVAEDVE